TFVSEAIASLKSLANFDAFPGLHTKISCTMIIIFLVFIFLSLRPLPIHFYSSFSCGGGGSIDIRRHCAMMVEMEDIKKEGGRHYWLRSIFVITAAGLCFSDYLSGVKLLSGQCALNEPCPY